MITRKTAEQIKDEILARLKEEPLSIEQLRKKVESNWSTTNNYLEELKNEGKVKEILSADKAKIYQRIFGDTYFDIPITDLERKKFRALFSMIIKMYKEGDQIPNKTQLAKAAVKVINSPESGLSELPTVWYLYGMIPLMIVDPSQDYQEEVIFEHKQKIKGIIEIFIKSNSDKKTKQIQKEQHIEYDDKLYQLADNFLELTEDNSWNKDKIFEVLNEFFIVCPISGDFKEVFNLTERFISTVRKLSYFDKLENHRTKILLTFDALWKFIATSKFYETISLKRRFSSKSILDLYLGSAISFRKACAEESLSDLYSVYLSKLDNRKLDLSSDAAKVREIMQGWTGED
ncbi:MAG: hypothetical protein ABH840_02790 [Nanoarchaeota archaeon]